MQPTFRIADSADLELIVELVRQYHEEDGLPFEPACVASAVEQLLGLEYAGRIWLICTNHMPVGYIVLTFGFSIEFHGRDAFIDEFFLQPEYRGRGWGNQAVRLVEQEARRMGVHALHLEVSRDNQRALDLYRRQGFQDHDRFLMSKWLDGSGSKR